MTLRYGSVCSGIEAASVAWHPLGWSPAFFAEIERFPSEVLAHHYGSNLPSEPWSHNAPPNLGDMTKFQEWPDADLDVLVGGTPCQSFSVAGLRKGLADPRGNLALTYLAILDRYRPEWMVWENVPGVLSSEGGRDFGAFLGGLVELGYGFAYRVLDAQYIRVDGFGRAVPQRRRRVFVVGHSGDWRRAAAVLFERESLSVHPAPRRKAGQGPAGTVACGAQSGSGGAGRQANRRASAQAFGGGKNCNLTDVSTAITAHPGGRYDLDVETFIADVASTLPAGGNSSGGDRQPGTSAETAGTMLVAHALRGEGFDASEDGTGRGTPIVPVPFDTTQITSASNYSQPKAGDPCHPLSATAHPPAIAYGIDSDALDRSGEGAGGSAGERSGLGITEGLVSALRAKRPNAVAAGWAVRRLTPLECERLQGFPDGYTAIQRNAKPAADGPRYKALGNSMAVNAMRWIGRRIELVDALASEARV